ncbi:glycosyltransferase [Synechococcus sp. CBW1006]|uniref:glycosyltransferase n=1 Tax=Synechococcus sp. CBW1006 TaxID=1353138 RepID=UPI0018CC9CD0|nr:glycosyltransferase [Synechococcus sp. CBW1006]QPN67470.1 glycosyltransferase [Synechococcus sp. CBW1006]
MDLTLCMVVKNEIKNLPEGLGKIRDLLDEVIVVDTGSTDGTQAYLREELGIEPLQTTMQVSTAYSKSPSRNMAIARVRTEWVLSLDADERIAPQVLQFLGAHQPASEEAGFFGLWRNHVAETPSFDDYKLFLFRRQYRKRGLVHENVQVDIRESGHRARWLKELVVDHFPDPGLHRHKTTFYQQRLESAVAMDPLWIRHHWFLGYMHF